MGSELPDSHFELKRVLGRGSFGVVSMVRSRTSGNVYARKDICWGKTNMSTKETALKELLILENVRHPCVVSFVGYRIFPRHKTLSIYLEYCNGGTLQGFIRDRRTRIAESNERLPESDFWHIFYELSRALAYLHKPPMVIIHRDIKPANILMHFQNGSFIIVKLSDFGLSTIQRDRLGTMTVGTRGYVAPELLRQREQRRPLNHTRESDIWALGTTMLELSEVTRLSSVKILVQCVDRDPARRPSAAALKYSLQP